MKQKRIYVCEDSIEGIFTAIYNAWESRYGHENNYILVQASDEEDEFSNMELFSEYIYVKAEEEKAGKVAKSIQNKISDEVYEMICHAVLSNETKKGDMIYRFLILGFSMGPQVVDCLSNDVVMNLFTMNRNVSNEAHHMLGFLRFSEGKDNILFAKFSPKNDIIRLIAPHFSERLNTENFIIYDEKRKTAVFHKSGFPWVYTTADDINLDLFKNFSEKEEEFRMLWKAFFNAIAIEERKNYNLQRNNLPKRFRSNMLEFLPDKQEQ